MRTSLRTSGALALSLYRVSHTPPGEAQAQGQWSGSGLASANPNPNATFRAVDVGGDEGGGVDSAEAQVTEGIRWHLFRGRG